LVGTALFVLGVVYLNLDKHPDIPGFVVVGGKHALAGRPTAVRVSARGVDSKAPMAVTVDRVEVDGKPVQFDAEGTDPTVVRFSVPEAIARGRAVVTLGVSSRGRSAALEHTLTVLQGMGDVVLQDGEPPAKRVAQPGQLRIDVLPENSVLAMGMQNKVVMRVRDHRGNGLANVPVRLNHKNCLIPPGPLRLKTDALGLVDFEIDARQPGIRLKIDIMPPGQPWVETEEPLQPRGRRMLLRADKSVYRPGDTITTTLHTWETEAEVHCDLLQEGAVLWSSTVTSAAKKARLNIQVPCEGLCRLQCMGHPWDPGDEFSTIPIVVTSEATLPAITAHLRADNILHPNSLKIPPGVDTDRAARYFLTMLQGEPWTPELWLSTRNDDVASRDEKVATNKRNVLIAIAVVFLLIVLVVADVVLKNLTAQRRRMKAFAEETLGDDLPAAMALTLDEDGDQERLLRTRGMLLLIAMVGALLANLVGIIWLLALVGEA